MVALTLIHGGLRSIGVSALRASMRSRRRPSGSDGGHGAKLRPSYAGSGPALGRPASRTDRSASNRAGETAALSRGGVPWRTTATTETSSAPIRQPREPPAAVKAAWRRGVKTLPSCGKNGASRPRSVEPAGWPPSPGDERGRRPRRAVKVRWHREVPARPHLPGDRVATQRRSTTMQRILSAALPAHVGQTRHIAGWVHRRRLLKSVAFLIVRDRAGLAQVVVTDPDLRAAVEALHRGDRRRGRRHGGRERGGARRGRAGRRRRYALLRPAAEPPPFDLYRPTLTASAADAARPRRGVAAAPARGGRRCGSSRRGGRRLPVHAGRGRLHRGAHAEDRRRRPPSRGANVFAHRLLRPARVPGPVAAVLQADAWSASSSGSTRSGRCSGPSRTTPCATWPSTPRWTSSSASSTTTAT